MLEQLEIRHSDERGRGLFACAPLPADSLVLRSLRYISGIESRQTRGYSNMNNLNITTAMSLRMLYFRFPITLMASLTGYLTLTLTLTLTPTLTLTLTLTLTPTPTPTLTLT